jgi:hypothetical protein
VSAKGVRDVGRDKRRRAARDGSRFALLPWTVLDSSAYVGLSVHAKALLVEMARQLDGSGNNGRLICSRALLGPRGWSSNDMITKSKRELLDAGLLFQTFAGQRPNKASWFAVTWLPLDRINGYDAGAEQLFVRSAYRTKEPPRPIAKTRTLDRHAVQGAAP